ncbi:MAG: Bacterial dnaA protein helix-turn-helix [Pseudomonadota bacterium]|jgi:hypothetical protein
MSMAQTIAEVCNRHRISVKDFYGPSRCQRFVLARWEAVYTLRQIRFYGPDGPGTGPHRYSYGVIARQMRRDPSTIRHAYAQMKRRLAETQ